jgi:hypothetical protein
MRLSALMWAPSPARCSLVRGREAATAGPQARCSDHRVFLAKSGQRQARTSTAVDLTMDVTGWLPKQLEQASPDLLCAIVQEFG